MHYNFQTDKFVEACESYCGPYIWKIYDLVILPPSFPYGGMENPCLTFVTPTLLVGGGIINFGDSLHIEKNKSLANYRFWVVARYIPVRNI